MQLGCEATAARRRASRLAGLAGRCPAPHTAPKGAGRLAGKQAGSKITAARRRASRLASLAGRCPAPHTAPKGAGLLRGKASWPGFYRRSATGLTARRSGRVPCIHRAQIAVAPAVPRLAPVFRKTPEPVRVQPARRQLRESRSLLLLRCKTAKPRNSSQPARGKHARRQLRGSRAAIGSGGKKPCPF